MPKKIKCQVGLSDMITGMGFTHIKTFNTVKDAKRYIRNAGVKGIPEYLRGKMHWTIKRLNDTGDDMYE